MLANDKLIKVQNRDFGTVTYTIPDLNNLYREYQPNEIKQITFDELFKLSQVPGGMYIITNYLIIYDEEAVAALLGEVEPEYFYTEKQVIELMKNGTADEFEDCLNFAPSGVLDLIKDLAVKLPLNDVAKRDLILMLQMLSSLVRQMLLRKRSLLQERQLHQRQVQLQEKHQYLKRKLLQMRSNEEKE